MTRLAEKAQRLAALRGALKQIKGRPPRREARPPKGQRGTKEARTFPAPDAPRFSSKLARLWELEEERRRLVRELEAAAIREAKVEQVERPALHLHGRRSIGRRSIEIDW